MSYTKEFIFTVPEGKKLYQSETIISKIEELKTSGDLINTAIDDISSTQKKITMVWKDIESFNNWRAWLQTSGEDNKSFNHMSTNNITLS